jgi:hypothetical protein
VHAPRTELETSERAYEYIYGANLYLELDGAEIFLNYLAGNSFFHREGRKSVLF